MKINPILELERVRLQISERRGLYRGGPTWNWSPQLMPDFDLWCLIDGNIHFELNGTARELESGSCLLLKPGDHVKTYPASDKPFFVLFTHFDFCNKNNKPIAATQLEFPPVRERVDDMVLLRRLAERVSGPDIGDVRYARVAREVAIRQLLMLIHEPESPSAYRQYPRVVELIRAIDADPGKAWSVEAMAEATALSRSRFSTVFQLLAHSTPNRYVIRRRVERAQQLLRESDLSLAQIADSLGYQDVYFFNRQFRQVTRETPGSLRK